jgi:glutamyl-tRNA reductase
MLEHYKVITFTHHLVDIADIGKYQIKGSEDALVVKNLKEKLELEELMYLSTCNRVSYITHTKKQIELPFIQQMIKEANPDIDDKSLSELENHVSLYEGMEAVQHVFEVAGSIDSLVVGESEIFRQFRCAYEEALLQGMVGDNLRLLEKITVQVAKRIYSHTRINEKPLSIAALAVQAILEKNDNPDQEIIFIGAGDTNTLIAKFLHKHHFKNISIFNRTLAKAETLAAQVEGKAYTLEEWNRAQNFDVLVVCTSSQQPIVTSSAYQNLIGNDTSKKTVVDLSVPANVDVTIADNHDVHMINIDQLKSLAEKNLKFRKQEISIAKTIVEEAMETFRKLHAQRQIELALADLPGEISKIKTKITNDVFKKKIENFDSSQREILDEILAYMEAKCVAAPMRLAKKEG